MRLTATRAAVGDFSLTSHLAKVRRESSAFSGSGWRTAGTPVVTSFEGLSQSPRRKMRVGFLASFTPLPLRASITEVGAPSGHCFQSDSILLFASLNSGT